jgi:drug/metabolite transporter (DMT)-like permease
LLAVVLALLSALGYGCSDFAAGLASRHAGVIQVTLVASAVSAVLVAAVLPFAASPAPSAAALAWGFVAGAGGTLGAFALYLGFRHAAFSVAGPISAVGAAGFSVLAGLLLGERPSALALAGIGLALPAIVGVSAGGSGDEGTEESGAGTTGRERPGSGLGLGLLAGAGFAVLFIALDRAGSGSGLWPVAAAQVGELGAAVVAALVMAGVARAVTAGARRGVTGSGVTGSGVTGSGVTAGESAAASSGVGRFGIRAAGLASVTGACGGTGTILYFYATQHGLLAVTAVLTSLYPAITIVLARVLLGERLTVLRLGGLVLAGACVALIAVGGAG